MTKNSKGNAKRTTTFTVDLEFYLKTLDASAKNRESDANAQFAMFIVFLTKRYYVSELKLSEIRALIGSGAEYSALLDQAQGNAPGDDYAPVITKSVDSADFVSWAKKYSNSSAYNFFANL
jgi:hypothetical protein